jgi:uncharacterized protein YheU (UPF0270 family)
MEIPYKELELETLKSVIESFVLREGTDYGEEEFSLEDKIEHVLEQLKKGKVALTFDEETRTCNIVPK